MRLASQPQICHCQCCESLCTARWLFPHADFNPPECFRDLSTWMRIMPLHSQLPVWVANAFSTFLPMQAVLKLQRGKSGATLQARQWKASYQAAHSRCDTAEARCTEVKGNLQTKCNEVDELCLSSAQQAEVSQWSYRLIHLVISTQQVGSKSARSYVVKRGACNVLCVC